MITLKTLEAYLEKCKEAEGKVVEAREQKFEQIKELEAQREQLLDQLKVISGQISTINYLMNIGEDHTVELPFAGDAIEEIHEKRLEGYKGASRDEVKRFREDKAYRRESMDIVEQMDEFNNAEDAEMEGSSPENDS